MVRAVNCECVERGAAVLQSKSHVIAHAMAAALNVTSGISGSVQAGDSLQAGDQKVTNSSYRKTTFDLHVNVVQTVTSVIGSSSAGGASFSAPSLSSVGRLPSQELSVGSCDSIGSVEDSGTSVRKSVAPRSIDHSISNSAASESIQSNSVLSSQSVIGSIGSVGSGSASIAPILSVIGSLTPRVGKSVKGSVTGTPSADNSSVVSSVVNSVARPVEKSVKTSVKGSVAMAPSVDKSVKTSVRGSVAMAPSVDKSVKTSVRSSVAPSVRTSVKGSVAPSVKMAQSVKSSVAPFVKSSVVPSVYHSVINSVAPSVQKSAKNSVTSSVDQSRLEELVENSVRKSVLLGDTLRKSVKAPGSVMHAAEASKELSTQLAQDGLRIMVKAMMDRVAAADLDQVELKPTFAPETMEDIKQNIHRFFSSNDFLEKSVTFILDLGNQMGFMKLLDFLSTPAGQVTFELICSTTGNVGDLMKGCKDMGPAGLEHLQKLKTALEESVFKGPRHHIISNAMNAVASLPMFGGNNDAEFAKVAECLAQNTELIAKKMVKAVETMDEIYSEAVGDLENFATAAVTQKQSVVPSSVKASMRYPIQSSVAEKLSKLSTSVTATEGSRSVANNVRQSSESVKMPFPEDLYNDLVEKWWSSENKIPKIALTSVVSVNGELPGSLPTISHSHQWVSA